MMLIVLNGLCNINNVWHQREPVFMVPDYEVGLDTSDLDVSDSYYDGNGRGLSSGHSRMRSRLSRMSSQAYPSCWMLLSYVMLSMWFVSQLESYGRRFFRILSGNQFASGGKSKV